MIKKTDLFLLKFIADSILNGVIDIVFAVREINLILQDYDNDIPEITEYFYYLDSELEFFPVGIVRNNFAKDFLNKSDLKFKNIMKNEKEILLKMCKQILESKNI